MESLSLLAMRAVVCGVAGPVAALVATYLLAPIVMGSTVDDPALFGDWIVGAFLGALLLGSLGAGVGAAAALAALVLTRCPYAPIAWLCCLVATPVWADVLDRAGLSFPAFVLAMGVLPAGARVLFEPARQVISRGTTGRASPVAPPPPPRNSW